MIAIPMPDPPMTMSIIAMIIRAVLRETKPQQTPLARGKQRQNLGSLSEFGFNWLISSGLNL
jgi:hypothetical protein